MNAKRQRLAYFQRKLRANFKAEWALRTPKFEQQTHQLLELQRKRARLLTRLANALLAWDDER